MTILTFVFALLVEDLGVVLQLLAVFEVDALLLLEADEGELVLVPQLLEVWPVQDVEELLSLLLGALFDLLGSIRLGHKELGLDLVSQLASLLLAGRLLEGEEQQMWVQEWSNLFKSVR